MALLMPNAMRFYKICAVLGGLVIVLSVLFAWVKISQFEITVVELLISYQLSLNLIIQKKLTP